MPRNYWRCPKCTFQAAWADVDDDEGYPDVCLMVIGRHVELCHPEMLYGDLVPISTMHKLLAAAT